MIDDSHGQSDLHNLIKVDGQLRSVPFPTPYYFIIISRDMFSSLFLLFTLFKTAFNRVNDEDSPPKYVRNSIRASSYSSLSIYIDRLCMSRSTISVGNPSVLIRSTPLINPLLRYNLINGTNK